MPQGLRMYVLGDGVEEGSVKALGRFRYQIQEEYPGRFVSYQHDANFSFVLLRTQTMPSLKTQ